MSKTTETKPGEFLDSQQLATALNVSRRHVYRMVSEGAITPLRCGGALRFRLDRVIEELEAATTSRA